MPVDHSPPHSRQPQQPSAQGPPSTTASSPDAATTAPINLTDSAQSQPTTPAPVDTRAKSKALKSLRGKRTRMRNTVRGYIKQLQEIDVSTEERREQACRLWTAVSDTYEAIQEIDREVENWLDETEPAFDDEIENSAEFCDQVHACRAYYRGIMAPAGASSLVASPEGGDNLAPTPTTPASGILSTEDQQQTNPLSLNVAPSNGPLASTSAQLPLHAPSVGAAAASNTLGHHQGQPWQPGALSTTAPVSLPVDIVKVDCFNGENNFRVFRAQLKTYLERRPTATGVEKLLALIGKLRGPPYDLVGSLEIIDANFEVALKLLEDNYGRPDQEERRVMCRLDSVPPVRSADDVRALRALLNHVQGASLQAQAVGIQPEQYALSLEQRVRRALPAQLLYDFDTEIYGRDMLLKAVNGAASAVPRDQPRSMADAANERLNQLLDCLRRYTVNQEDRRNMRPPPQIHRSERNRENHPPKRHIETTAVAGEYVPQQRQRRPQLQQPSPLQQQQQQGRQPARKGCLFCSSFDHRLSRCTSDLTLQQKKNILLQRGRCVVCFRPKHPNDQPCEGVRVPCSVCASREHYSSMHPVDGRTGEQSASSHAASVHAAPAASLMSSLVMTATAIVSCAGVERPVRIFLDPGSMLSFVSPALLEQLPGARPAGRADLTIRGINCENTFSANRYRLCLRGRNDRRVDLTVYEHDFSVDPQNACSSEVLSAIRAFGDSFPLADASYLTDERPDPPSLLIGIDYYYKVLGRFMRDVAPNVVATESMFGWVIGGNARSSGNRVEIVSALTACCSAALSKPARDVERLWTTEVLGIAEPSPELHSVDEADALKQFNDGLKHDGKQYTVALPKRSTIATLKNNLELAVRRLISKRRSLEKDPAVFARYDTEIMTFVRDGYAVPVPDFDASTAGQADGSYYMPHHQVVTQGDGGKEKWRIVFDCSSSGPGATSLNTHLLPGPNLNPDIVTLLVNFRAHRVAFSADVAKAYMTLKVQDNDARYFRFLWQGPTDDAVRCYEMKRVTWGAAPSGFLLAATLRHLFARVDPQNLMRLGDSFYHDDMLRSFSTEREALAFTDQIVNWLGTGGMSLAKWKTNSRAVAEHLRRHGIEAACAGTVEGALLKVLGIVWTLDDDQMRVKLTSLASEGANIERATKRTVLRFVASIFDPLGWLSPFTLRGKRLIQDTWQQNLKWDDLIDGSVLAEFKRWAAEVAALCSLRIPRCYHSLNKSVVAYHMHVFGDASEIAYAAVAYLQTVYADGSSQATLIMSKSRLAPRKKLTLPRLELMAALIAARLRSFLLERLAVKVDRVTHYTDSTTVYHWCTVERPSRWKQYVCNRVMEIQKLTDADEWLHVDGPENIADFATRGEAAMELRDCRAWWEGPRWLCEPRLHQPCRKLRPASATDPDVVTEQRAIVAAAVPVTKKFEIARCGTLDTALRVLSCVIAFIHRLRRQPVPPPSSLRARAEILITRWTQEQYLSSEIGAVRSGESPPTKSPLAAYQLFIDDHGLLRIRTRLGQTPNIAYDEANPVVIPGESHLARLLVTHHHRINAHFGVNVILNALRRRYWVTRGRQVTKAILHRCVVCRRSHGPTADQVQAPLPAERVTLVCPFQATGVDFCGPFRVRGPEGTMKSYIALFTCAAVRAVHLELVPAMSAPDTLLALRRFLAEYPECRTINSDNGRSFVKAATEVKALFNKLKRDKDHDKELAGRQIEWTFNCPRAAWRGGYFERLVGTVKSALSRTLGKSLVGFEELRTILVELAAVINSRPLTYVDGDADAPRPLTPAHFLKGGRAEPALALSLPLDSLGPNGVLPANAVAANELRSAVRRRQNYSRALAVRWYREYLLQLRSAQAGAVGRAREIRVGDVCLLKEDNKPRLHWNLVRVIQALSGRDGLVRTYGIRFANGFETKRAAQLLIPLEVGGQ